MWLLYTILTILLLPTAVVIALHMSRIRFARTIVARTEPAQSCPEGYCNTIVVAGDSTAFGVGALPAESTAGRLAAAFPRARVVNVARSGNRIGHVAEQLDRVDCPAADLVLIQACANDVLEFRPVEEGRGGPARRHRPRAQALAQHRPHAGPRLQRGAVFLRPISRAHQPARAQVHAMVKRVIAELGDGVRRPLPRPGRPIRS